MRSGTHLRLKRPPNSGPLDQQSSVSPTELRGIHLNESVRTDQNLYFSTFSDLPGFMDGT